MEIFDSSLLRINLDLEDKKKAILLLADAIEQETLNCRAEVEKLEALCEAHMRTAGEKKQFELTKGLLCLSKSSSPLNVRELSSG
jgi:hypothetical protein